SPWPRRRPIGTRHAAAPRGQTLALHARRARAGDRARPYSLAPDLCLRRPRLAAEPRGARGRAAYVRGWPARAVCAAAAPAGHGSRLLCCCWLRQVPGRARGRGREEEDEEEDEEGEEDEEEEEEE
ncbi:unnamed protein product, partial [Prorocentrum cordatum]